MSRHHEATTYCRLRAAGLLDYVDTPTEAEAHVKMVQGVLRGHTVLRERRREGTIITT
jgi:hypothetical protein